MTLDAVWIDAQLKKDIKITAAKEGVSMKEVAERAFRLGLAAGRWQRIADELAGALRSASVEWLEDELDCPWCGNPLPVHDADCRYRQAQAALAAFDAATQEPIP